jgi:3-hydroxyacyl-[acyl-carrier-protein] dehydratase
MESLLDIENIRDLLPHRFPFLLVDKVLELVPGERVVGLKNVTINEPFFMGHFPGQAVMPGVLIIESMAQVAGLMVLSIPEHTGKLAFLGKVDKTRFRKPVVPGDSLVIEATLNKIRSTIAEVSSIARVDGKVVAEADMTFALKPPPEAHTTESKLEQIREAAKANAAAAVVDTSHATGDFADETPRTLVHHGRTPVAPALVATGDRRD